MKMGHIHIRSILLCYLHLIELLQLAEQACFSERDNLARSKHVTLSTQYAYFSGHYAVDGFVMNHLWDCVIGEGETTPWMVVDFQSSVDISTVVIFAARSPWGSRATNVNVEVGDAFSAESFDVTSTGFASCGQQSLLQHGEIHYLHCKHTLHGRYLLINNVKSQQRLTYCEIQVFSTQVFEEEPWICIWPNLLGPNGSLNKAKGKSVELSSIHTAATFAVDGSSTFSSENCARGVDGPQWLVVDLGTEQSVIAVALTNTNLKDDSFRLDSCTVWVGNTEGPATPFDSTLYDQCVKICHRQNNYRRYYPCDTARKGRRVAVERHKTEYFYLCELEVYTNEIFDLQYPTVEPEYNGWNLEKAKLFDKDDKTCMDFGHKTYNRPQITFILEWHPDAYDATNKEESTHHCMETFYVNITHSPTMKVFTSIQSINMEAGPMKLHNLCPLFGTWSDRDNMKHSKFECSCTTSCTVKVGAFLSSNHKTGDKLCEIYLYN